MLTIEIFVSPIDTQAMNMLAFFFSYLLLCRSISDRRVWFLCDVVSITISEDWSSCATIGLMSNIWIL